MFLIASSFDFINTLNCEWNLFNRVVYFAFEFCIGRIHGYVFQVEGAVIDIEIFADIVRSFCLYLNVCMNKVKLNIKIWITFYGYFGETFVWLLRDLNRSFWNQLQACIGES